MGIKARILTILIIFAIIDVVIPVPITGIILIYVLLKKPPWFIEITHKIYGVEDKQQDGVPERTCQ